MQTKKGFILVYTVLVGIICLIIMMYIFDIQMAEVKYSTSNKKYILKEDSYQKEKEYLMTLFFTYINENNAGIKKVGTIDFFCNIKSSIVKYKVSKVNYSNKTNEFIFITPFEYTINRNDYYKLAANGESFKLVFIKTEYY
jgi:S-adenosylmethionine hydrolase